jgi:hypothetical protein
MFLSLFLPSGAKNMHIYNNEVRYLQGCNHFMINGISLRNRQCGMYCFRAVILLLFYVYSCISGLTLNSLASKLAANIDERTCEDIRYPFPCMIEPRLLNNSICIQQT